MDVTRMDQSETIQMFKSKLRFQIRFWFFKTLQRQNYSTFPDTETSVRESVRRKRIYRASLTGTTGQESWLRTEGLLCWNLILLFLISADGIFLNHLSQDIRGTNSSAVWRSFHIGQPLFYSFACFKSFRVFPYWPALTWNLSGISLPTKTFCEPLKILALLWFMGSGLVYTWICYCYSLKDFLQVLWYREDNTWKLCPVHQVGTIHCLVVPCCFDWL